MKDFSSIEKHQLISQFPNEWLLTTKIGLMETAKRCRQENEQHPSWFPPTYDLRSEISNFMAHYEGIQITVLNWLNIFWRQGPK